MSVTNLWPLIFVILVPLIVLLYMLKQKGTDQEVSSTLLWQEAIKNMEATTPWEKYKHNILMYLQILTVLLLMFALMAPFIKQGGRDFAQMVLVIDNSASMNAIYEDEVTRFEEAKVRARAYIESLNDSCAMTIISVAKGGEIVATNVTDKSAAKKAVDSIMQTDIAGSVNDCMDMVRSISGQWEKYGVTIYTDTAVDLGESDATVVNLYSQQKNLAVNYVSFATNEDKTISALAKISNFSTEETTCEVNLYGDGSLLDIQKVVVPAADSAIVYFEAISFQGVLLTAEINGADGLLKDNTAGVVVNGGNDKRVLLVTGGNTFLEKALTTVKGMDLFKTTDLSVIGKNETFDLYIFDGVMPDALPESGNIVYINPSGDANVVVNSKEEGVSLSFLESEVTSYLTDTSFGVSEALVFERPIWANSFLGDENHCCGYYGEDGNRRIVALGFDIHGTDFALKAEFPIMVYNLMTYVLESGLTDVKACMAGDKLQLYSRGYENAIVIKRPDEKTDNMDATLASKVYSAVDLSGLYTVSQETSQGNYTSYVYAAFPVDGESSVEYAQSSEAGIVGEDSVPSGGRELRNTIIVLLLLLLLAEWFVYVREY